MLLFLSGVTVNKQPSAAAATQHKENELHLKNYAEANYQEKSTSKRCRCDDESRRSAWTFLRL